MTEAELRIHFDLKPSTRPAHEFKVRNLIGQWRMADDCWAQLVGNKLQTLYFSIHTTKSVEGLKIFSITMWKLKVIWALL